MSKTSTDADVSRTRTQVAADATQQTRLALCALLGQLAAFLSTLTLEQYRQPAGGGTGTIGGHVRHTLDHVSAWLGALESGSLDYDQRERGTSDEFEPAGALQRIAALDKAIAVARLDGDARVGVVSMIDRSGARVETQSTIGRELVFVFSHAIHHAALMAAVARAAGAEVPSEFGYAPSTLHVISQAEAAQVPLAPAPHSQQACHPAA